MRSLLLYVLLDSLVPTNVEQRGPAIEFAQGAARADHRAVGSYALNLGLLAIETGRQALLFLHLDRGHLGRSFRHRW